MSKPHNPPAFPMARVTVLAEDGIPTEMAGDSYEGMTLRDYFAAQAMPQIYQRVESGGFERVAKLAYDMADAMLQERAK